MKSFRITFLTGVLVTVLSCCSFIDSRAQSSTNQGPVFNSEALWKSYDHNAFMADLQQSLGLGNAEFDAFQKYLILQKDSWRDRVDFFTKARTGIINPINLNAYFDLLKNKYYSYYPAFKTYSDNLAAATLAHTLIIPPTALACGQPCTNPGYETNDFTAWNRFQGNSVGGSGLSGVSLTPGNSQTSITSAGPDPVVGATLNMVYPAGGTHSAMIGDGPTTGAMAGELSTSFTVSAATTNFTYAYAVVLEDPGHPVSDQPYFFLSLTDQAGNVLNCGAYAVTAGPGIAGFTNLPGTDIYYRNWTTMFVDLTAYVGQCVTMTYVCRDCTQGGHYGYAYVDASCAPAQIVTSSPAICGSSTITLTAPPGASAYSWTGPGIVGGNASQVISVNVAGTYSVVMTSAMGGCTTTLSITVPGNPSSPTANFSATTVCAGAPMTFTDLSKPTGGITAWDWDFNADGVTDATTANPTYTFAAAGTYPVHLTITWPPCTHDTIINVTVTAPPAPSFTAQPVCVGTSSVFITPVVAPTYSWSFGDGSTDPSQDPTHLYAVAGTYTVTLTVTTAGGCTGVTTQPVVVSQGPLSNFTAPPVCMNTPTLFTNTTTNGTSYTWHFGDGTNAVTQSPTHTYGTPGTFSVTLVSVGVGGCTNTVTIPVVVNALPTTAFTGTNVCQGVSTVFTDGSTITAPGSINMWSWNFGDGTTGATQNGTHTYPAAGTYTVELTTTSTGRCVDSISHVVTVYSLPVVTFTGDSLVHCNPWCVNFADASTVAGGTIVLWSWNFGDGSAAATQTTYGIENHCYTIPGTYGVTLNVTSNEGCKGTLNKPSYITTWPSPEAAFTASPQPTNILDPTVTFTDQSTNAATWNWKFGDGDSTGNATPNPVHLYNGENPSTYTVQLIVTSIHGCIDTAYHPVVIGPIFTFFIPNCYTPNGDGHNDLFYGYGVGIAKYELIIFDRWGNHIFTTTDLYSGWDGTVQGTGGTLCQEDVYVWKVNLKDVFGLPHNYIGHVSLIR
jgi:gliding motility-associated-like protein